MTISRVFDQLETHGIGEVRRRGRERVVTFSGARRNLWTNACGILSSPIVRKSHVRRGNLDGIAIFRAGETALARMSTLAEPPVGIYAVSPGTWQTHKDGIDEIPVADENTCTLQVWRYDPGVLATDDAVDPFSLWLCGPTGPHSQHAF